MLLKSSVKFPQSVILGCHVICWCWSTVFSEVHSHAENLWGIVKRKMRDTRPNNADELKATVKETLASIPPQQCHKLITSMPRRIEAVIKAKGAPTKYCTYTVNEHTFQKANNSLKMFFLLVL